MTATSTKRKRVAVDPPSEVKPHPDTTANCPVKSSLSCAVPGRRIGCTLALKVTAFGRRTKATSLRITDGVQF